MATTLSINGETREVDTDPRKPLLWVLREDLDMPGTKFGCGMALCGACTVHVDGKAVRSCTTPISTVAGKQVTTIEHVATLPVGRKVSEAWTELDVPQCGYCQAGQIMSATALLSAKPSPSDEEIDQAMSGNICRCATYLRIRAAIKKAAASEGASA
ncbi:MULTISPECIES: (2Fe-2S)-binding protein [Sphingobium]|uniref:Isoquinoline 1-oxidoreductase alpha subunit n=1 Tax=Sphingobium lignivorans TaxID=2735886 RepID=A0ABR6NEJ1_9SPHN|nr:MULTISPECIES: (2Fe-2S)-binding protein [Sphingobium]MBB5985690.1 isoquinoline 1-oxidoreductase alpha subunit [Sphingobium lignivorans]BAK66297.1 oxidoreductase [Sphingobium sp. SYK-6]